MCFQKVLIKDDESAGKSGERILHLFQRDDIENKHLKPQNTRFRVKMPTAFNSLFQVH